MTIITNETIANGAKKFINTFEQIEKMARTDGSKESALKMIQEVYPDWKWENLNTMLFCMDYAGLVEGLTIEGNQVIEPVRPKLTDKAKAEIEAKKEIVAEHE